MDIKPKYIVYIVSGFIVSGWFYFIPGRLKIHPETIKKWEAIPIPEKKIRPIYFRLELWRKIKQLFKR